MDDLLNSPKVAALVTKVEEAARATEEGVKHFIEPAPEGYMLDLSQYAGARKRRGLEIIEFWKPESKESLRRASLIYSADKAEANPLNFRLRPVVEERLFRVVYASLTDPAL